MVEQTKEEHQEEFDKTAGRTMMLVAFATTWIIGVGLGSFFGYGLGAETSLKWHNKDKLIMKDAQGQLYKVTPVDEQIEYQPKKP